MEFETFHVHEPDERHAFGLYVHIPFCARKCPYCDFTVVVNARREELAYVAALERELAVRRGEFPEHLATIYVGGGTPGILEVPAVDALGDMFRRHLSLDSLGEFTVEFNPEHATPDRLRAWRRAGATRVSLGVQALSEDALKLLGREHNAAMIAAAIAHAKEAGFLHISIDFIFGLPGISPSVTAEDVRQGIAIPGVDHVSMYELTIEQRTAFGVQARRGELRPASDDALITQWRALTQLVEAAGFQRYEVSNYARPGARAQHNASYWTGRPYLGIGVSAASLRLDDARNEIERRANARPIKGYLEDPLAGATTEVLGPADFLGELLTLGLRTRDGVDLRALERRFGLRLSAVRDVLRELCLLRWVRESSPGSLRFGSTDEGMEIADSLALQVLDALDKDLSACQTPLRVYPSES